MKNLLLQKLRFIILLLLLMPVFTMAQEAGEERPLSESYREDYCNVHFYPLQSKSIIWNTATINIMKVTASIA